MRRASLQRPLLLGRRRADGRRLPRRRRVDRAARRRPGAAGRRGRVRPDLDARLPRSSRRSSRRARRAATARSTSPSARSPRRSPSPPRAGRSPPPAATGRCSCSAAPRPSRRSCRSASPSGRREPRPASPPRCSRSSRCSGLLVAQTRAAGARRGAVPRDQRPLRRARAALARARPAHPQLRDPHRSRAHRRRSSPARAGSRASRRSSSAPPSSPGACSRRSTRSTTARGPEEVLEAGEISLEGHSWAHLNSFPSGHMAITAALAGGMALAFPRRASSLGLYVAAVAFTRVLFGALPARHGRRDGARIASALLVAMALDRASTRHADSETAGSRTPLDADEVVADDALVRRRAHARARRRRRAQVGGDRARRRRLLPGRRPAARRRRGVRRRRARPPAGAVGQGLGRPGRDRRALEATRGSEAVIVIDADGQHPPEAIAEFVAAARVRRPRGRRPLRRPGLDAVRAPTGQPHHAPAVRARERPSRARHAERDAAAPRRRARALPRRRLRGGDDAPPPRAPSGAQRRVGTDAGDLRSGAELVPSRSGLGGGAVGTGATARTTVPATAPIATPSRVPTTTSDRKCTPRYTRDTATTAASASSGRLRRGCTIPTATAAANAVAEWPEGNDADAGSSPRRRSTCRRAGPRPVERLLEDHHREPGSGDRAQRSDRGPRQQAAPGPVADGADGGDQRPLHPPGRREQEHEGQWP